MTNGKFFDLPDVEQDNVAGILADKFIGGNMTYVAIICDNLLM